MNDHHLNLLQAEIDGLNTEAESQTVRNLIASDAELKVAYEELQAVKLAMASLVEIEPPPTLRESIMNAIPENTPSNEPAGSIWSGIVDLIRVPRPVSLAYAFSLGLIVAFVVSTVFLPPAQTDSIDQIAGTMAVTDLSDYELIAEYEIEDEEGKKDGTVRVARRNNRIFIEFVWDDKRGFEARVVYDEEWADVIGTHAVRGYQNRRTKTVEGEVTVSGTGPGTEFVTFEEKTLEEDEEGELNIEVNSGSRTLLRRSLLVKRRF
jgi:hypothetical protein